VRLLVIGTRRVDTSIIGASQLQMTILEVEAVMRYMYLVNLTAVNQEVETARNLVLSGTEDNNSESAVKTDVSVRTSARKLQDLLTNAIVTLTVTITKTNNSKFQAECSNLRSDIVTLTRSLKDDRQDLARNEC